MLQMVDQEDELMKLYDQVPLSPPNFSLPWNPKVEAKKTQIKKQKDLISETKLVEIESKRRELLNRYE